MLATAAARAGLAEIRDSLSQDDEMRIATAAAGWAARWQAPAGHEAGSLEVELEKWRTDWTRRDGHFAGWRQVVGHAQSLGAPASVLTDLANEPARDEFTAQPEPAPKQQQHPLVDVLHSSARDTDITKAGIIAGIEAAQARPKLRPLSLAEIRALPAPSWLIDGLLPAQGVIVPYGRPKSGKTFLVLSAALHIAAGKAWMNRASKQGAVVYVAGEGIGGVSVRLAAMQREYGIGDDVPLWVLPSRINFGDDGSIGDLIDKIRARVPAGTEIVLIVFDTLARMIPGLDENSAQAMGTAIAATDRVREAFGCSVALVHHSGKDEERGMRGSSA